MSGKYHQRHRPPAPAFARLLLQALFLSLIPAGVFLLAACGPGGAEASCELESPENMRDPGVADGIEIDSIGLFVRINWSPFSEGIRSELGADYFSAAEVSGEVAQSVELAASNELMVRLLDDLLGAKDENGNVQVSLIFPDRQEHTSCSHECQPDVYTLVLTLTLDAVGEVDATHFSQRVDPGAC
jgi:hypothetical protein